MPVPVSQAESVTAPSGTGTTITITLPAHQEDDILIVQVGWKGNQAPQTLTGWTTYFSTATGTATNGCGQGVWWRRVGVGETVSNPTLTIGTTAVERRAIAYCIRGADIDNPANTFWQKQQTVGNSASPTPPGITTLAPNYLLLHLVTCRGNSAITPPTGYNEEQDSAEGTTVCVEGSTKTQATAATVSGQSATISSNRWVAAIIAIPSPDYPYFRSQTSQTATATSITGTLPTGTTAADFYGRKDLIIATVEAAGTAPSPNTPGDWTSIATWETTTSGGATTVRKYYALYDGSIDLQFNRSGSGEISLQLCTYRNPHQTTPLGNVNVRQNASSTTSTWDALSRSFTKSTVNASCVADGTPTYTSPTGWTERSDGNGITTADQIFEAGGSTASASFTLSAASPTAVGLVEIKSHAGASAAATLERSAAVDGAGAITSTATFFSILERNTDVSVTALVTVAGARVVERSTSLSATGGIDTAGDSFLLVERSAAVDGAALVTVSGVRIVERNVVVAVTGDISVAAESFSIFERAVAVDTLASVGVSGARVVERSTVLNGAADILTSGEFFSLFEAAVSLDATAGLVSSAEFFSVSEAATVVDASGSINASGIRIVERSISCSVTAAIDTSAQFFSVFDSAALVNSTGDIIVSGTVISGSGTHERAASCIATAEVTSTGLTVRERSAAVSVDGLITTGYQREHFRAISVNVTGDIASSAYTGTAVARAASFNAVGLVSVTGGGAVVFNPTKVFNVDGETRILPISREGRIV